MANPFAAQPLGDPRHQAYVRAMQQQVAARGGPFAYLTTPGPVIPQQPNETNLSMGLRNLFEGTLKAPLMANPGPAFNAAMAAPVNILRDNVTTPAIGAVADLFSYAGDTPAKAAMAARAAPRPAAAPAGPQFDPNNPFADVGAGGAQPRSIGAGIEQAVSAFAPGAKVTSGFRSVSHNAAVGGVSNSFHTQDAARDYRPPAGTSIGEFAMQVKRNLGAGFDVIAESDHVHVEPKGSPAALASGSGFVNPFDASKPYFAAAHNAVAQAGAAQATPFSVTTADPYVNAPAMPDLQTAAPTDFTASDRAFAAAAPKMIDETEQRKMVRSDIFKGIGQALVNVPDGAGLGKVLAAIGGGALAGRGAGESEVRARLDQYDQQMSAYNLALARNEQGKAATIHAEAQHNVDAINARTYAEFEKNYQHFEKTNFVSMGPNGATISRTDGKGKVTMQSIPNAPAIAASTALAQARLFQDEAGNAQQGAAVVASPMNSLAVYGMMQQYQNNPNSSEGKAAMAQVPALLASGVVKGGYVADLLGGVDSSDFKDFTREAYQKAGLMPGAPPTSGDQQERLDNVMLGMLLDPTRFNGKNVEYRRRIFQYGTTGRAIAQANALDSAKQTTKTDNRGRSTTTMSMTGGM
jgi:hypothetical protein